MLLKRSFSFLFSSFIDNFGTKQALTMLFTACAEAMRRSETIDINMGFATFTGTAARGSVRFSPDFVRQAQRKVQVGPSKEVAVFSLPARTDAGAHY